MEADVQVPLGIIAGSGSLPRIIIAAAQKNRRPVFIVAFKGHTDEETVNGIPHMWTRMGAARVILSRLRAERVKDIVMAGAIRRPSFAELRPDWYAARFYARVSLRAVGDDGLLRAVGHVLEEEGFRLVGASDLIGDAMAPAGLVGRLAPDEAALSDIARGIEVVRALGRLDVGQAVVVQQGIVLGVEAAEGTDALIERAATLIRQGSKPTLLKFAKPQQDQRLDLPTIGLKTLTNAAAAGFGGIVFEADKTILLDTAELAETANRLGLFLIGMAAP